MWHVCGREEIDIRAGFWCGNLKVRDRMEDLDVDGKIILKMDLEEYE